MSLHRPLPFSSDSSQQAPALAAFQPITGAGATPQPPLAIENQAGVAAALLAGSGDFMGAASLADEVLFINPAGRAMVGLGEDGDLRGAAMIECIAPDHRDAYRARALPSLLARGAWAGETWLVNRRTGAVLPVWHQVSMVRPAGEGEAAVVATLSRDLSERHQLRQALGRADESLARASDAARLTELAAAIAHEINQPLAAMATDAQACLHWLAHEPPNLHEARAAARRVVTDGLRGGELVERMHSLVRQSTPRATTLDLNEVVRQALQVAEQHLPGEAFSLRVELHPGLPVVRGDPVQLRQVVINLMKNGIEAMLDLPVEARDLIVRSGLGQDGSVQVEVLDSGNGLDGQSLERLYEPFYTTKAEGMGLGLAISQRIIGAHGGELRVAPGQGGGASACFSLPASDGEAA